MEMGRILSNRRGVTQEIGVCLYIRILYSYLWYSIYGTIVGKRVNGDGSPCCSQVEE